MQQQLFLSHDHRDSELAGAVAIAIGRITLNQLKVWYSSDVSHEGGMRPGSVWLDEIRSRLSGSKAVIPLITPNSVSRPWLWFETGFGAAHSDSEVIPVCLGLDRLESIPFPLAMYQCYLLTDYESLRIFFAKLLGRYGIPFDEEMGKPVLERTIGELARHPWPGAKETSTSRLDLATARDQIMEHLDLKLMEFFKHVDKSSGRSEERDNGGAAAYSVPITLEFEGEKWENLLEIRERTTVQGILDNVYFMLSTYIEPFKYLQTWIIREKKSGRNLVVREFGRDIPAHFIFKPGTVWVATPLSRPYSGLDSEGPIPRSGDVLSGVW
jgi:TIR domain